MESSREDAYITCATETQKQVGVPVNQAAPLISDTLGKLWESMRLRMLLDSDAEAITMRGYCVVRFGFSDDETGI